MVVIAFCCILLWHNPLLFWNDDYEISILPVFADVARSWSEGHLPLLSPYSWVCSNLAGEFQYGTFSIFVNAAVVLIWKFALTFPQQAAALSMTHLFALAMGAYLLARGRNLSAPLSMMVALVATLNGWIMCWGATDWFGALGAWTWLPWAWWGLERALDPRRGPWRFLWPAPFVYLLVTGGFPYTVGMLGLLTAWLALKSLVETKKLSSILPLIFGSLLGLGLSAPAWLALFDYVHGSARQADPASAHFQWLVPPTALPAFILPNWTVNWTNFSSRGAPHTSAELACGLVAPVALLAGLFKQRLSLVRRIKWELILLVLVLIISMLPSANLFRWSFRWLPLVHLLLALCAAEALQLLELSPRGFFRGPQIGPVNRRFHYRRDVAHANGRSLCVAICADPFLSRSSLGHNRLAAGWVPNSATMDAASDYIRRIADNISVPANKLWRSEIQSQPGTLIARAARSGAPLSEHLSAAGQRLRLSKGPTTNGADRATRQHFDVGRASFR